MTIQGQPHDKRLSIRGYSRTMRWSRKSNRLLAEAIVDAFRSSPENSRRRLSSFTSRDWLRTEFWLDASGLALYFLDHVQSIGIEDAIDPIVIQNLKRKLADNKGRRSFMFEEFVSINRMFEKNRIKYANLKGFTLSPASCPNPDLRFQIDFDFLLDPEQRDLCRSTLEKKGYVQTVATPLTWEFKAGTSQAISMGNHYKASPHRSVELHFTADETDAIEVACDRRLSRLGSWSGFPALLPVDQIIGQALHILAHLRSPLTRPSWLLEFRNHVITHKNNKAFWHEVHTLASTHPHGGTALGLSVLLATELFGSFSPLELNTWTLDQLPLRVRLWAEHYGRKVLFADFPGTKLYLLLDSELTCGQRSPRRSTLQRLIPLRRVPRVLHPEPNDSLRTRIYQEIVQLRFVVFRLRFHVEQGILYTVEFGRWKRLLKDKSLSLRPHTHQVVHH